MKDMQTEEEHLTEKQESDQTETKKKRKWIGIVTEILVYALIIALCVFVVPRYVVQRTEVDGDSMNDTLKNHENLLVEKCIWHITDLNRFDIVTFYPKGRDYKDDSGKPKYYIKRVIGLPGEKVQVVGDTIYINDKVLDDSKYKKLYNLDEGYGTGGIAEEPLQLKDDEYFVMGDHRGLSEDSRSEFVGPVKEKNIDGRVFLRIYPFSKFGTVD